jgi:hypothetical protein
MRITRRRLKELIKEQLLKEFGGVSNFGGIAGQLGAMAGQYDHEATEDDPDSLVQQKALEFFRNLELTPDVVRILVQNIAIPDLVYLMKAVPKIGTAEEEELQEVYSDKQRSYMCAMKDADADERPEGLSQKEAEELCKGPMKKKKKRIK